MRRVQQECVKVLWRDREDQVSCDLGIICLQWGIGSI